MKRLLSLLALIAALLAGPPAAAAARDAEEKRVDRLFASFDNRDTPGFIVGVWRNGRTLLLKGYGMADLETATPIAADTRFMTGSNSKQFTAFAVALLAAEGRINLDADVRTYLPTVPDFGTPITVRHLLLHTSGLRDHVRMFQMAGIQPADFSTNDDVMRLVARQRGLNFEPGSAFLYTNTSYVLLAEIVEAVSGQSLRQFTRDRMFEPLGMRDSFFLDRQGEAIARLAIPYSRTADGAWRKDPVGSLVTGSAGLVTSMPDFVKWMAHLSRPRVGGRQLMADFVRPGRLTDGRPIAYAFGLETTILAGRPAISHGGSYQGFKTNFAYFPEQSLGVAVFTNTGISDEAFVEAIAEIYIGRGPGDPARVASDVTPPSNLLASLPGHYLFDRDKAVTLRREGAGLLWEVAGEKPSPVRFRADGSFGISKKWGPRYGEFFQPVIDGAGRVSSFVEVNEGWDGRLARYHRFEPVRPENMGNKALAGTYCSTEIDTCYRLSVEGGGLVARRGDTEQPIALVPVLPDRFDFRTGAMTTILIDRGPDGRIAGFRGQGFRVSDVQFVRNGQD